MLKWGILSTAKIGREYIIPAIHKSDNGVVHAIASRDLTRAQSVAERFAIPKVYGSYDDVLSDPDIDAVYIPLITSQHVEWAVRAADAGKHVLCEKPMAQNASEIEQVIEAQKRNNVVISEAFMVTYHPQWLKLRKLIADGAIGELHHVQAAFTYFNDDASNMRNIKEQGGGALLDIGVYPVVTTRFATGKEAVRVQGNIRYDDSFGTDTFSSSRVDFGSFELSMYVSTQMAFRQSITFHGDKGWIDLASPFNAGKYDDTRIRISNSQHEEIRHIRFPGVDQYQLEVEAFAREVFGMSQPKDIELFSLESSVKNQCVIDAIFKAGGADGWVEI